MRKIVTFKKQWLASDFGQGVCEAVPEVQPGRVTAAAAEIAVGCTCHRGLLSRHGLNADLRLP